MNLQRSILSLLLLVSFTISCQRVELTYDDTGDYDIIQIDMDWSRAGMNPDGATVVFYPKNNGTPIKVLLTSNSQTVKLKKGIYSIIAINNSFNDLDNIVFRNTNRYETIEAYAKPIGRPAKIRTDNNLFAKGLDRLAIAKSDYFEVTQDMVNATQTRIMATKNGTSITPLTTLTIQPILSILPITVNVKTKGIQNVRYAQGVLTGLSEGILLSNYKLTSNLISHFFDFMIVPSVSDYSTGYMSAQIASFGFPEEIMQGISHPTVLINNAGSPNDYPVINSLPSSTKTIYYNKQLKLEIYAPLIDNKTTFNEIFDVNAEIKQMDSNLTISVDLSMVDVPNVSPPGGGNSGFNAEVNDWGTTNRIPISI